MRDWERLKAEERVLKESAVKLERDLVRHEQDRPRFALAAQRGDRTGLEKHDETAKRMASEVEGLRDAARQCRLLSVRAAEKEVTELVVSAQKVWCDQIRAGVSMLVNGLVSYGDLQSAIRVLVREAGLRHVALPYPVFGVYGAIHAVLPPPSVSGPETADLEKDQHEFSGILQQLAERAQHTSAKKPMRILSSQQAAAGVVAVNSH